MRYLLALLLVLSGALWRSLTRYAPIVGGSLAALAGIWYATSLNSSPARAIIVCYFVLELSKLLRRRG